jgi:hypothetical protein
MLDRVTGPDKPQPCNILDTTSCETPRHFPSVLTSSIQRAQKHRLTSTGKGWIGWNSCICWKFINIAKFLTGLYAIYNWIQWHPCCNTPGTSSQCQYNGSTDLDTMLINPYPYQWPESLQSPFRRTRPLIAAGLSVGILMNAERKGVSSQLWSAEMKLIDECVCHLRVTRLWSEGHVE